MAIKEAKLQDFSPIALVGYCPMALFKVSRSLLEKKRPEDLPESSSSKAGSKALSGEIPIM